MRKTLKIGRDRQGHKIALVLGRTAFANPDKTIGFRPCFEVFIECANHANHCRGGLAFTWRVIKSALTRDEAEALHEIWPVHSRFGRLYMVGGTNRGFRTFDEAKVFAGTAKDTAP